MVSNVILVTAMVKRTSDLRWLFAEQKAAAAMCAELLRAILRGAWRWKRTRVLWTEKRNLLS